MPDTQQESIINKILEGADLSGLKVKDAAPQVFIEILYEYLSQSMALHYKDTVGGLETVHQALIERRAEHVDIARRLHAIEARLADLEKLLRR